MISERLKKLRNNRGLSQGQLAEYASVSQSTLSDLETGKISPKTLDLLYRVSEYSKVPLDWIFGLTDDDTKRTVDNKKLPRITREFLVVFDQLSEFRQIELLIIAQSLLEREQEEQSHLDLNHFDQLAEQLAVTSGLPQPMIDTLIAMLAAAMRSREIMSATEKTNQGAN